MSGHWAHVKKLANSQNGRKCWLTLNKQLLGKDKICTMENDINIKLVATNYSGDRKKLDLSEVLSCPLDPPQPARHPL